MATKGLREITAIASLLVLNAFFGISDKETSFIFPAFGEKLFAVINFYTGALAIIGLAFALVLLYRFVNKQPLGLPEIPQSSAVVLDYMIFFVLSYVVLTLLLTGDLNLPIPSLETFVEQNIIAADENTIAFIFLATIFPVGAGLGSFKIPQFITQFGVPQLPWNIITFGEYKLNFNPPNVDRFVYGLYGVGIITLLHAGAYSFQVNTFNEFYFALTIAGVLFAFMWWLKESVGFGSTIAFHSAWNIVLISVRGSVF